MARFDPTAATPLGTAVTLLGATLLAVGGAGKPGALDMLPGHDGAVVAGVLALILMLLQGFSYRVSLVLALGILSVASIGLFRGHSRPLAPIGLSLAIYGLLGVVSAISRRALFSLDHPEPDPAEATPLEDEPAGSESVVRSG